MISTLLAIAAFALAAIGTAINLYKFLRDRKKEAIDASELTIKARAERDSIAVRGAENALEVMEKMLRITQESETQLRQQQLQLRREIEDKDERIGALEETCVQFKRTIFELRMTIADMEQRLVIQEKGGS